MNPSVAAFVDVDRRYLVWVGIASESRRRAIILRVCWREGRIEK